MSTEHYNRRHFYASKDNSSRRKKFKWYIKELRRLNGAANDVNIASYYPLVMEYHVRSSKLDKVDVEAILYVSRLNRVFSKSDLIDAPNTFRLINVNAQVLRLEQRGYIERWEGHGSKHHRRIQYRMTSKARIMVTDFDKMLLRDKKIPLDPAYSNYEFVTPRRDLEQNRFKIDWHLAILDFNNSVNKEKDEKNY